MLSESVGSVPVLTPPADVAAVPLERPLPALPTDVLTEQEARLRASRVSDVHLSSQLELARGADRFRARAQLEFRLADARKDLRLDLKCGSLDRCTVNGHSLPVGLHDGHRVLLPASHLHEGPNRVECDYETAYERSGNGLHRFADPSDGCEYLYSNFEPFSAHRVVPCFDQPDLKTCWRLRVTAPADWQVVSNTLALSSKTAAGRTVHEFAPTRRLSPYLLFVGAGPYAVFSRTGGPVPMRLFSRQSMADHLDPDEIFEITEAGLEFFGRYYGFPYPFGKYDQLFVPEFNPGGMENPGAVVFNEVLLFRHAPADRERARRADVILHEMAHMWFGDLVTMRWWDGLWLNESFATYMAAVAQREATRWHDAFDEFVSSDKAWALWQDQLPTTHAVDTRVADTDSAFSNFDGITYGKGAALLAQLAFFVGNRQFRDGVRGYMKRHAWGNTDRADFFRALGETASIDLSDWSRAHLSTAGVNTLLPRLESEDGTLRALHLEQSTGVGDRLLRPQRVEVALYPAARGGRLGKPRILPVLLDGPCTAVPEAAGLPAPAFVWPNHGEHAYLRVFLDEGSLRFARRHLDRLSDGLTRRSVWLTLWEMVRDSKLAPVEFLDTFLDQAPLEPNLKLQQASFRPVLTTLNRYLTGPSRDRYLQRVHRLALERTTAASAGSDGQKEWFDLAVETAAHPAALDWLEAVLDGKVRVPGLELHSERRWNLVTRLSAFQRPGVEARIESEIVRDPTDFGARQALRARVSAPDLGRKQALWSRCLDDRATSTADLKVALTGLHWPHQETVSRRLVEPYFDTVCQVRTRRDQEFGLAFAELAYPGNVADPLVLSSTRAFLASRPPVPADLRKVLLNASDELARTLRLRARTA